MSGKDTTTGPVPEPETKSDEKPTSSQLIKSEWGFPGPSMTGSAVIPAGPKLMLTQGAGFSSFSSGPSPWLSQQNDQKASCLYKEDDQKEPQNHAVRSFLSTGNILQEQCAQLAASMSSGKMAEEKKPASDYRDVNQTRYSTPEEGEIRSHDDASRGPAADREDKLSPVNSDEVAVIKGQQLGEIEFSSLSPQLVVFYFGVLRLQDPQLDPNFEYTKDAADGSFHGRLTMYRDTLKIPALESMTAAKVELCRVALSILKVRSPKWRVPDEPSEKLTAISWRWAQLLRGELRFIWVCQR